MKTKKECGTCQHYMRQGKITGTCSVQRFDFIDTRDGVKRFQNLHVFVHYVCSRWIKIQK